MVGEGRGIVYFSVALAVATAVVSDVLALVVLAVAVGVAGIMSSVTTANLLAWYSAVLSEEDRRLVVPRLFVVALAASAVLLFPMGVLLDLLAERLGLVVYAVLFGLAGLFGVLEVRALRRLPRPGRVTVPPRARGDAPPETAAERQFLRIVTLNALGMGFTPLFSVYAMSVLGLSAGFSMTMGAIGLVAMLLAAAVGGSLLPRGSSARHLRFSFAVRAVALSLPLLALPGTLLAPVLMYATSALAAVGFAVGQLATNERMFRLVRGPAVIRQHGRMLFRNSAAMTVGQVAGGVVLAVLPVGYPAFAILFSASAGFRALAYRAAGQATPTTDTEPAPTALPGLEAPARAA